MTSHTSMPSLQDLAAKISTNVSTISTYLDMNRRSQLSFDPLQDQELPDGIEFEELQTARFTVMEQTKLLYDLAAGPTECMTWLPLFVCSPSHIRTTN